LKNECPGTFGACAGSACNGAGACQYLAAGEQSQPACKRCSGSSYTPVNIADNTQDSEGSNLCNSVCVKCSGGLCVNQGTGEDLFNQCSASWTGCSSICVKSGLNGNCNGAGACAAATANVAAGYYCSSGSEVSGPCNSVYACTNAQNTDNAYNNGGTPYWTQGFCDGGGSCDRSGTSSGDGDESSTACSCIRASTGYWNIGGEISATTCCGDDTGENKKQESVRPDAQPTQQTTHAATHPPTAYTPAHATPMMQYIITGSAIQAHG